MGVLIRWWSGGQQGVPEEVKEECCSRTEVGITGNLLCCSGRQVFTVFAPTLVLEMHPFLCVCVCVILYEFVMK